MSKRLSVALLAAALLIGLSAPAFAADDYTIDGMHSAVSFKVSHLGLSWTHGRFNDFSGAFALDPDASKCSFSLTIQASSIDTNNKKRDAHLSSPDFFNVKQYPTMAFKSTAVKAIKNGYEVTGDMTLHGKTKSITFALVGGRKGEFPKGVQRTGFSTDLVLKRSAALAVLLAGWPWRRPRAGLLAAGGAVGVGSGLLVGTWVLGLAPHFPPQEDQDRLLLVLLPATVAVEVVAALLPRPWLAWLPRLAVAAGAAPVLLYGSVYVSDAAGPGTREWSPELTWLVFGGLAAALALPWALLVRAGKGRGHRVLLPVLALVAAGAGVTVMLSGYASGGQLGLVLAGGLLGAALASLVPAETAGPSGPVGVGIVGLFALLAAGRFFSDLTTVNAVLLLAAPLAGGLACLLPARVGSASRAVLAVLLAAVPVAVALILAGQK
jgi:polyisoprenoid-binding protein YceI